MKNSLKFSFTNILFWGTLLICLLQFSSCCKCDDPEDIDCPNYDPCYKFDPQPIDFGAGYVASIKGHPGLSDFYNDTTIYFNGDTISGSCEFYALNEDVDSFYWKIGDDPRIFRNKSVYLEFPNQAHMSPIQVELMTKRVSECFEDGWQQDTLRKTFIISNKPYEAPNISYYNSKYSGYSTEYPNEILEIEYKEDIRWICNFPKGTNGSTFLYRRDYDEAFFRGQSNKTIWQAHAKFQKNNRNNLVIKYKISHDLGKTISWHEYNGVRVE